MKILIIKLSALGDIIHALPVLTKLNSYFLEHNKIHVQTDWVVSKKFAGLLKNHPQITNLFELENNLQSWLDNIGKIKKQNYDYVLDLQGLLKTGLFAKLTGARNIVGLTPTREKLVEIFYKQKIPTTNVLDQNVHIIERNLQILKNFDVPVDKSLVIAPKSFNLPEDFSLKHLCNSNKKSSEVQTQNTILIAPETSWQSKNWPKEKWIELINKLSQKSKEKIVLVGSDKNFFGEGLTPNPSPAWKEERLLNLMGETTLQNLMGIVSEAKIVIGGDSGVLHLAAAYGIKTLGLYGATSPRRTGPWNGNYIYLNVDCSPCHKRQCSLEENEQLKCLTEIKVDEVLEKILDLNSQ